MANSKLTDLTALLAADPLDLLYLVDVSDSTDHASGSSKKITAGNLLGTALSILGGLTPAADKMPYFTGVGSGALADLTSFGRSLAAAASAAAVRTLLGGARLVQIASSIDGVAASGTTTIPFDDSIPQSGEGTHFYSVSITPTSASNTLLIFANLTAYPSTSVNAVAALFQDSTANAIATSNPAYLGGGTWKMMHILHSMTAGTTSATTFKLRAGPASAATVYVNGNNSGRLFGGTMRSGILVLEVAA